MMVQADAAHGTVPASPTRANKGATEAERAELNAARAADASGYERVGFCFLLREGLLRMSAAEDARRGDASQANCVYTGTDCGEEAEAHEEGAAGGSGGAQPGSRAARPAADAPPRKKGRE